MDSPGEFRCGRCGKGIMLHVKGNFVDGPKEFWACNICYHTLSTIGNDEAPILHYDGYKPWYEFKGMAEIPRVTVALCGMPVISSICGMPITLNFTSHYDSDMVKLGYTIIPVRRLWRYYS